MEEKTQDGTAVSIDYSYDKNGNRIQMNEYVQATNAHNVTDYTYDANNRMTSITNTVSNEVTDTTRFYYDDNGNTIAEQNKIYSSGAENSKMLLSGRSGGGTMKVYEYDKFNRLIKYNDGGTEATYTYNANNLRQSKTVNGIKTSFVWNGQNLAGETKNGTTTSYTYDSTGIILSDNETDTTRYIKDPHGNVVATSRNNTIIGEYDYTAFGNQTECTDTSNPFRYCGEYYDDENGLVYLRNRYYNSTTGRFITEDPAMAGLNWYVYCENEPITFIDPFGLDAFDLIDSSLDGLSDSQKRNIYSAQHAKEAGYITDEAFARNVIINGGEVEKAPGLIVSEDGDNITITAYSTYNVKNDYGYVQLNEKYQFTQLEIKQAIKQGIEKGWSGQYLGKNIKTNIIFLDSNSASAKIYDTFDLTSHEGMGLSTASVLSGQSINIFLGTTTGETYNLATIGYVAAHEFGHAAFKLLDIYKLEGYNQYSMNALMCNPKKAKSAQNVDFELMASSKPFINTSIFNGKSQREIVYKNTPKRF